MKHTLPFQVRPLESRDIPTVMNIDRIVFNDPWPESAYVQEVYFNPNAHYFVLQLTSTIRRQWRLKHYIERDTHLLGFVGMRVERERGHISTLAVRPEWRGRGLGELLLVTAIQQAIHNSADTLTLEVRISNHVAQDLYTKYGFEIASRLHRYYSDGEDAYLMRVNPLEMDYQQRLNLYHEALLTRLQLQMAALQQSGEENRQ
jgi:ribosomal-protein-alanine N-acetyltransferase